MIRVKFEGGCKDGEERLYIPEEYDRIPHPWHVVVFFPRMFGPDFDRCERLPEPEPLSPPDVEVYRLVGSGSGAGERLLTYRLDHRVEKGGSFDGRVRRGASIEVKP